MLGWELIAGSLLVFAGPKELNGVSSSDAIRTVGNQSGHSGALGSRDARMRETMLATLQSTLVGWRQREMAAVTLGALDDPQVIPALLQAAEDTDLRLARTVVLVLGGFHDDRVFNALLKAMEHPDVHMRECAIQSLAKIGNPDALPALLRETHGTEKRFTGSRYMAVKALGGFQDPKVLLELKGLMESENQLIRAAAVLGLEKCKDDRAVPLLQKALKDVDRDVRLLAGHALKSRGISED